MSLRALPEHHQLIRRMARALIERPDLAESLTALIEGATQGVPQDATRPSPGVDQRFKDIERRLEQVEGQTVLRGEAPDVLPAIHPAIQDLLLVIQQRQLQQEETTRKVMAFAQSINDSVVKDRQARTKAPPQHTIVTQRPPRTSVGRGAGGGNKRLTDEQDRQIADMLKAGRPYPEIAAAVGVSSGALTRIKERLERQGLLTADQEDREGQPPLSIGGLTAIPDEHSEEAYLCQIAGMTIAEAIELKGWTWKEHELAAAVERWCEQHRQHVLLLLEQHRQVAAMLKAGKAAEEIKAWLNLQKATEPASHVDDNPAPPPSSTD
jgi:uncharacterized protein YerC